MGNCIGDKEFWRNDFEYEYFDHGYFDEEIFLSLRNMDEDVDEQSMDEEVDEQSKKSVLKQSEKCEPTRKPSLRQSEKFVTRFFKKVAVFCCDNSHARSTKVARPPAPSKCGEETDSTASFGQLELVVEAANVLEEGIYFSGCGVKNV